MICFVRQKLRKHIVFYVRIRVAYRIVCSAVCTIISGSCFQNHLGCAVVKLLRLEPDTEADIYYIGFNWGMINKKSFVYDKLTGATPIAVNIYDNRLEYQRFLDLMQSMLMKYENDFPYKDEYLMNTLENLLIITFRMEKGDGKNGKSSNTVAKQALISYRRISERTSG